jgi:hypothetical protein
VTGDITDRTRICANLHPDATAAEINSAIAACTAGQVVKLSPGTYNLSTGIHFDGKSNITLRGAGPDKTFMVFESSNVCRALAATSVWTVRTWATT